MKTPAATGSSPISRKSRRRSSVPIPAHAPTQALRLNVNASATSSAGMTIADHTRSSCRNITRAAAVHATSMITPE